MANKFLKMASGVITEGDANSLYPLKSGVDKITVGGSAPESPSAGDLWVDTNVTGTNNLEPKGLYLRYHDATTVRCDCAAIWVEDYYKSSISNLDAVITNSGAGGLDAGSEANSTWYYVWLIVKSSDGTPALMLSTSPTSPTMPSGYDKKRLIGTCYNNSSGNIREFTQKGGKTNYWDQNTEVLSVGQASSWTNVSLTAFVPPNAILVILGAFTVGDCSSNTNQIIGQIAAHNTHNASVGYNYGRRSGQENLGSTIASTQILSLTEINLLLVDRSFDYVISSNTNGSGGLYVWVWGYQIEL